MKENKRKIAIKLLNLFLLEGKPAGDIATIGQLDIFSSIVFREHDRVQISTYTQYGKSLFTAFAVLILSALMNETVTIVAPNESKAKIIMRYCLEHLGDNAVFSSELDVSSKVERLKTEQTKERIKFRGAGGIFVLSAEAGNAVSGFEKAMGEGSRILILDEASLIPDNHEATIFRMITGKSNACYIKIGNPFYRNHFFASSKDKRYHKISIDWRQGLNEGRIKMSDVDEARTKPFFSVLYENKFPEQKAIDMDGYAPLVTEDVLTNAYTELDLPLIGDKRIGIDLASGGENFTSIWIRGSNAGKRLFRERITDQMVVITFLDQFAKKHHVAMDDKHIFPDKTGASAFCSRLNELYPYAPNGLQNNFGVIAGAKPDAECDNFGQEIVDTQGKKIYLHINKRSQMSLRASDWLKRGGKIIGTDSMKEALNIRYKVQSDKKMKIKSKEDMMREGIPSPDDFDAFALTFALKDERIIRPYKQPQYVNNNPFGLS